MFCTRSMNEDSVEQLYTTTDNRVPPSAASVGGLNGGIGARPGVRGRRMKLLRESCNARFEEWIVWTSETSRRKFHPRSNPFNFISTGAVRKKFHP